MSLKLEMPSFRRMNGSLVAKAGCPLILAAALAVPAHAAGGLTLVPSIPSVMQRHHSDSSPDFSTEARQRFPWFVSLGLYVPSFTGDNTSNSAGAEIAVGYRYATDIADYRISVRGQEYSITDAFFNQSTIDVSEVAFDALFRFEGLYAGPGIALGSVTGTTNGFTFSGANQTVFSATLGYDISPRLFIEARYQMAGVDAYKGYSLNLGYRF